jgi:hypothetical protein
VSGTTGAAGTATAVAMPMRRVRRLGYAVLALELAGFGVWSAILYHRFALTFDFALNNQAWFLIAHGNLDPSGMERFPYWQDHSAFMMWPLSLLYWLWPHGITLLWLEDLCLTGAAAVAFTWLCEGAESNRPGRDAAWLAGAGLVLLAANPWLWWAASFDFHFEPVAVLFAVLLARDLANDRRRAWAWVIPLLGCGDVASTYLAGVGVGGVLAGRRSRVPGAVMACAGVAALLVITLIHGNRGSGGGLHTYAYLTGAGRAVPLTLPALVKGMATHPLRVVRALWVKRVDVLASLAPVGLLGIFDALVLPLVALVMLENILFQGLRFAAPIFQYLPVYLLMPVGTVAVLGWLARRRRMALLLGCLLVAQALGWAAVWAPRTPRQWLRVSVPAAATLASIQARIPASAEVIASEGIVGRFSGRADVHSLSVPGPQPVRGSGAWFVVAPWAGIEIQSVASALALIGELAGPLHATLVTHAHGVWAFRWHPPPGVRTITVPGGSSPLPAWASPGAAGRAVMTGPAGTWHVRSTGGRGYVVDRLDWLAPPGGYQARVALSATGPVNVEVWNDTGDVLLARQSLPATSGVESVVLPVDATTAYRARAYSGWGPFRAEFVQPPAGEMLEARVWSPGGARVSVYSAELIGGSGWRGRGGGAAASWPSGTRGSHSQPADQ